MKHTVINQLRKSIKQKLSKHTQTEAAKFIGISQSYLSHILTGRRNPKNAKEILEKYNNFIGIKFSKN